MLVFDIAHAYSNANASAVASGVAKKNHPDASSRRVSGGEPQLRILDWQEVSRTRSQPSFEPLMNLRELTQFAKPSHPSARFSAMDTGAYLFNRESSLGIDPTFVRLKNRDELQLLPELDQRAYFGLLHSHTFASDGFGTAEAAFRTARDIAGLDFFAVTDHSEYWLTKRDQELQSQIETALKESRPHFIALAGFEYSHTLFGHVVVLNSKNWTNAIMTPRWKGLLDWLNEPGQKEAVAIFAHPGFHTYRNWFDLEHFRFDPRLKQTFVGVEFIHRNVWRRSMKGYSGEKSFLDEALQKGWHVGPVASQDNHSEFWGLADSNRLALLMNGLSRESVLEALRARRFYSTQSPQLQLALGLYDITGKYLATLGEGVSASKLSGGSASLRVRIHDPNPHHQMCRFDVLVDGERIQSLTFLDAPSGHLFLTRKKFSATGEENCSLRQTSKVPWWEKLLNNRIVTGRAFEWVFEPRPPESSEVFELTIPLQNFDCSRAAAQQKRSWNVVVRLLQAAGGEKLTLTSPVTVRCDDSMGAR